MSEEVSEDTLLSTLYHALRASRRRAVITTLANSSGLPISVRDLAKKIAASEENVTLAQATGEPYRNAYNALSQSHLPMLAEADIIIYDSDRQVVSPGSKILVATMLVAVGPPVIQTLQPNLSISPQPFNRQSTIE